MRSIILLSSLVALLGCSAGAGADDTGATRPNAPAGQRWRRANRANAAVGTSTLAVGGVTRTYSLHVPPTAATGKRPLVIVLHGGFGNGSRTEHDYDFDALADRAGFAVAYPDGLDNHWNDGREDNGATTTDDVGFIRALIDELIATQGIDARRVYVTGMSNGAIMSYRLACELADRIVAIAPVAGSLAVSIAPTCRPARAVSVLEIHGTDDPLVPYGGGAVGLHGMKPRGEVIGVAAATQLLARAAGCAGPPTRTPEPDRDPDDGTTVERTDYTGCPAGIAVTLLSIHGGGHTWPGRESRGGLGERLVGRTSHELSATERIWQFFDAHR